MSFSLFFKDYIYLFLERGEGRGREVERNMDVWEEYQLVAFHVPSTRDKACSLGMSWPGTELGTSQFGRLCLTHWDTLIRANFFFSNCLWNTVFPRFFAELFLHLQLIYFSNSWALYRCFQTPCSYWPPDQYCFLNTSICISPVERLPNWPFPDSP